MSKILLLIEDDKVLLDMYKQLFLNHGYDVQTAIEGEEGLNKSLKIHPDLILLDIIMPKMDGMSVLKRLREDNWGKTVKVIVLTNIDPDSEILDEVIRDYPTFYLIKSNNKPELVLEKVEEVLNK